MDITETKEQLEYFVNKYNGTDFIESDPISIPHLFTTKEDIEISAFLSATIAWGNRKAILKSAKQLIGLMANSPYEFIKDASDKDFQAFDNFKYRTFNGTDCVFFLKSLQNIYLNYGGLESVFAKGYKQSGDVKGAICHFRDVFFAIPYEQRTQKHLANPMKNSAAKRLNMLLRWLVRKDNRGVDFGIWDSIPTSALMLPLDVHSGRIAREFGLLSRKQNDWKAVEEVTQTLRVFDPQDPAKYDFALFGIGVNNDTD